MIETYCGSGDYANAGAFQQGGVACGAGAGNQCIGIAHHLRRSLLPGEINYLRVRLKRSTKERYFIIANDLHQSLNLSGCAQRPRAGLEM